MESLANEEVDFAIVVVVGESEAQHKRASKLTTDSSSGAAAPHAARVLTIPESLGIATK